jgi:Kef-type K+ transport system membrane component KefB
MRRRTFFRMPQLQSIVPALGSSGDGHLHGYWWVILALIVFALVAPLAYALGRNGGQPQHR